MINLHNLNERELQQAGIFFGATRDAERFVEIVKEDLEVRVGEALSNSLTHDQLNEFDTLTDQREATAWLEKNSPGFRDIVTKVMEEVENELYIYRMEINALNMMANDKRKPAGRKQRKNIMLEDESRMTTSTNNDTDARYQIKLKNCGPEKIKVIKLIREITGLGLKEAKELCDTGGTIRVGLTSHQARLIEERFEVLGAEVSFYHPNGLNKHGDTYDK